MKQVWNDKLLSRSRAADMSGDWELKLDYPYLRCNLCNMNVLKLPDNDALITVDGIMSATVRHMTTTAHGYTLSGTKNGY